jgi:hypothetical protein
VRSLVVPDAGAYTAEYEALRAQMIAGDARAGASDVRARGVALAVLVRDGLPAWLAAVEPLLSIRPAVAICPATERTASDETRPARAVAPDVLPPAQQGEVTLLLAALVLSTTRSARRDPSLAQTREGAFR